MRSVRFYVFVSCLLITRFCWSQSTPFSAVWSFEGNANGNSSSALVAANTMTTTGVNIASLSTVAYPTGQVGTAVNIQNWSTSLCNNTEYVEFTVQPAGGTTITLTSLSFYFARSAQGPQQLSVRSSVDGFTTDLTSSAVSTTFQAANVALSSPGFINQSGPVRFRIYACNPTSGGGTLRLDEVTINGAVLPVELLYFNAHIVNDRVELAWATVWERQADRFLIERSRNLLEFGILGSVPAKGTTDQPQQYTFTDPFPDGGTTYYRLKQIDSNGATTYSKPVAVTLDSEMPDLVLLGNPVEGKIIRVAARNLSSATFSLITQGGQWIALQPETLGDGSIQLRFPQSIAFGLHWLRAEQGSWQLIQRVLLY